MAHTFDNAGNLVNLTAGEINQGYDYNARNLLTGETLTVDGKTFSLGYEYNSLGHLKSLTYPDPITGKVEFAPNAFGQATKARGTNTVFATNANYYPNGTLASFTYGNGIVHKTTLDNLDRPSRLRDTKGTIDRLNLAYDGLDRLTSTTGNVGIGSSTLEYDALGNNTRYTSKKSALDCTYNMSTNLLTTVTDTIGNNHRNFANGYDARGNVTSNGNRTCNYNLANQMTSSVTNNYLYDGHNRRVKVCFSYRSAPFQWFATS